MIVFLTGSRVLSVKPNTKHQHLPWGSIMARSKSILELRCLHYDDICTHKNAIIHSDVTPSLPIVIKQWAFLAISLPLWSPKTKHQHLPWRSIMARSKSILELTLPSEFHINTDHQCKCHKYVHLMIDLQNLGYSVKNVAVEVVGQWCQILRVNAFCIL